MGECNFSQPISIILREETSDAHVATEHSQGAGWLARGELDLEEYVRFLMMFWHIYDTLERALERHGSNPVLEPTYNPTLLSRASNLASDIAFFLQCPEATWQSHPAHTSLLLSRPQGFVEYITHLQALSDSADPSLLLAHTYVRYLGDLSGGQVIRRRVAKAYGIDLASGEGVKFYDFKSLDVNKRGDIIRVFDISITSFQAAMLKEANKAFELKLNLFCTFKPPKSPRPTNKSSVFLLGDPDSDIDDNESILSRGTKNIPIEVVHGDGQPQERMVSLASVLSVVAAVCLAHFLLVTTGLTGTAWIEKLKSIGLLVF
ncbi:hypothetical protein PILCRDRAFT_95257 [Piloderma croceum F 1598]|uniref:Uncharacterized protein n=1 Tax=Piloderma croceum (strain F 1598) TaxID=765440 RepID=A0A0C3BSA6_PILCF|nr:hypothetical protein PILCRDRAFT_95257 [Piloderma croceum F 1598]